MHTDGWATMPKAEGVFILAMKTPPAELVPHLSLDPAGDLARFAQPITTAVRDHIIGLARQEGIEIEQVQRKNFRQEDRVAASLKTRGTHPGLVHIFAVKEAATVFDTRRARADGYAQVIARRGACMHYYVYWMDPVYFNGHTWLAHQLDAAGISYQLADNALSQCGDWPRAQALADRLDPRDLHEKLKELTTRCCPASHQFPNGYHGCLTQVEYAQDLVFKHYREVVHRDGTKAPCLAAMRKSIDSLRDLAQVMRAGVKRYSQWLAGLREHTAGQQDATRLGQRALDPQGRSYRGFNPFLAEDERVLDILLRGEHALAGVTARRLRSLLGWTRGRVSRLLRRFRWHGLLRKVGHTDTYHLTPFARRVVTAVLDIRNNMMIPRLAEASIA
jgi:uncharacterized lipoprotein YmbA